jgi:hypothetical protein
MGHSLTGMFNRNATNNCQNKLLRSQSYKIQINAQICNIIIIIIISVD